NIFGADIISLGKGARMNHIKNVTRLVQGYLIEYFGYDLKRSSAAAYFILVYNAVKRNDTDYYQQRFVPEVMDYVPAGKFGIATHYSNWPGNTYIIIPTASGFDAAEVGQVATDEVAKDGKHITEREEMLKTRKEQAARKAKEIEEERQNLKNNKSLSEEERAAKEKELQQKEVALADETESIKDEEEKLAADKAASDDDSQSGEDSVQEAQANISEGKVFFLKTKGRTGMHLQQELNVIDPTTDQAMALEYDKISGRHLNFVEDDPVLIVYDNPATMELHLARMDRATGEIINEAEEDIFHDSKIWKNKDALYVIGCFGVEYYLLKYDKKLDLKAKSSVPVFPDTDITFFEDKLYCTVMNKNFNSHILVLDADNLIKKTEIKKDGNFDTEKTASQQ
ncbi:MAG TPA: P83/100 family protein, partial [Spirochaetota bacterium]|nr:P83/100 family protein [Spirochaetota bacterium]